MSHSSTSLQFNVFLIIAFGIAASYPLFRYYAGLRRGAAANAWVITSVLAAGVGFWRATSLNRGVLFPNRDAAMFSALFVGLLVIFGSAFGIRLYRKWLDGALTDAERAPGAPGFRAWLSPGSLIMAAIISVCAWQAFGVSPLLMLFLTVGALVAWPVLRGEGTTPRRHPTPSPASAEQAKVLAMLEAGKITAEESADLLNALAAGSARPQAEPTRLTSSNQWMLIGAGLVLAGFFLPWFSVSAGAELERLMNQMGATGFPMGKGGPQLPSLPIVHVAGGDIANGLGWAILFLVLAAAVLPFVATNMDAAAQRTLRYLSLGIGSIMLLYLVTQNARSVAFGMILVIIGYAVEWVGAVREDRAPEAAVSPLQEHA